jgi:hypothetical protein
MSKQPARVTLSLHPRHPCDFIKKTKKQKTFKNQQSFDIIKMFYEGNLQSGIGKAVQESKLVACFVTGICVPQTLVLNSC